MSRNILRGSNRWQFSGECCNCNENIYWLKVIPAQDIHVLKNSVNENNSPWYTETNYIILTPEYTFTKDELKSW